MGRRALPKIRPDIDTSKHVFALDDLSAPFSPQEFFANPDQPLQIEIGSGKGLFINNAAREFPDQNFVGVELAKRYAQFAGARLARDQIDNAIMISGDGLRFMKEFVQDKCCTDVHVYFPDPWWKERHRKRRVMKESLIQDVQRVLVPGGRLHFWTDVKEYFDSTRELLEQVSSLEGPFPVEARPADHDLDYRTHFERRMRLNQKPVYRSLFRNPG